MPLGLVHQRAKASDWPETFLFVRGPSGITFSKYPVFPGLSPVLPGLSFSYTNKTIMKQVVILLASLTIFPFIVHAQITTRSISATKAMPVSVSELTGGWAGTQTDMTGVYSSAIVFQLTSDGQFTMGNNQNGVYPVMGTYTISSNTITGSYKAASSGETFSFLLAYDAAAQTLNGTIGIGSATNGHAKWTASKTTATLKPQGLSTVAPKGTNTSSTPAPPPPAKVTSPLGTWTSAVRFHQGGSQDVSYVMLFEPDGKILIAQAVYNDLDIIGWGTYSINGNKYSGMLNFYSRDPGSRSRAHYYTATLENNRLIGTLATLIDNIQGDIVMTFKSPPEPDPPTWIPPGYDRCPGTFAGEYYLIDARVRFYTGNDNKELQSRVRGIVTVLGSTDQKSSMTQIFSSIPIEGQQVGEFKVNSETIFMLSGSYMPCYGGRGEYYPSQVSLSFINTFGLGLTIEYSPNFFTDAWKIEKVELILHFRKPDGTPHPIYGDKVVTFLNSSVLLNGSKKSVTFYTDRFLMPKL